MNEQINKITFAVIITAVVVGGVVYYLTASNKSVVSIESQNGEIIQSQDDNFGRNQECLRMKDEIAIKLESRKSSFGNASLEQIFYSPKINSCMYVEFTEKGDFYNKRLFDIRNDGYSSEPLIMCSAVYPSPIIRETYEKSDSGSMVLSKMIVGCDNFGEKLREYQ